jgi:drug/metabolite transporter (DMT)-like permease
MNHISGRWKLGLLLALSTAIMWGVLPVALKGVMETLDPFTVTFFRFSLAGVLLTPYLWATRRLTSFPTLLSLGLGGQFLLAGLLLACNYGLYIVGLEKTTSEAAQVMIQLAPMLLLVAGIWVFNEPFSRLQWLGVVSFVSGLGLFFNHHAGDLFVTFNDYGLGMLMVIVAAICWAGYAIVQKFLLRQFSSQQTMLVFYVIGALVFLPFSDFAPTQDLSQWQWLLLAFCGVNTLIAYGCFAEALAHLEASRVSAIIALTPLLTVLIVQLIPIEGIVAEPLGALSLLGALMVVCGSVAAATAKGQTTATAED